MVGNALKRCSSFLGFENLFGVAAANVYVYTSKCQTTYCEENTDKKLSLILYLQYKDKLDSQRW